MLIHVEGILNKKISQMFRLKLIWKLTPLFCPHLWATTGPWRKQSLLGLLSSRNFKHFSNVS